MGEDKIKCIYAFIGMDNNGNEGIVAASVPGIGVIPLIGADLARVKSYQMYAQAAADCHNRPIVLSRFSIRSELDWVNPVGGVRCKDETQTS